MDLNEVLKGILNNLVLAVIAAVGTLLTSLILKFKANMTEKSKSEMVDKLIERATKIAVRVVEELQQTMVDALKDKGEFTPEVAAEVKRLAVVRIKAILGEESVGLAAEVLGDLDALLSALVESIVKRNKDWGTAGDSPADGSPVVPSEAPPTEVPA